MRTVNGYILLENDFDAEYEDCKNNFFTHWPKVAEKILEIAKKSCNVSEISNIFTKYEHLIADSMYLLDKSIKIWM